MRVLRFIWSRAIIGMGKVAKRTSVKMLKAVSHGEVSNEMNQSETWPSGPSGPVERRKG